MWISDADAGDEQHEHQRQRIEQEADVDLEAADRNPVVQVQADLAVALGLHREEQHDAVDEQHDRDESAEPVTPLVHVLAAQEQDRGRHGGDATSSQAIDWRPCAVVMAKRLL